MSVTLEQIKRRCAVKGGCWEWQGATLYDLPVWPLRDDDGTRYNLRIRQHIFALSGLPKMNGRLISTTCGKRLCCNPAHLGVAGADGYADLQHHLQSGAKLSYSAFKGFSLTRLGVAYPIDQKLIQEAVRRKLVKPAGIDSAGYRFVLNEQ
jgi:hypothetical protein